MKAIRTRYLSCTNNKPARIKASDNDGHQVTVSIHHPSITDLQGMEREGVVAQMLISKMYWGPCTIYSGGWGNDDTYWIMEPVQIKLLKESVKYHMDQNSKCHGEFENQLDVLYKMKVL